jgi:hypothetical protein
MEKYEIHNTNLQTVRIGGDTLPELLPVAPFPPSTPSPQHHDEEGVVHPWTIGSWK